MIALTAVLSSASPVLALLLPALPFIFAPQRVQRDARLLAACVAWAVFLALVFFEPPIAPLDCAIFWWYWQCWFAA